MGYKTLSLSLNIYREHAIWARGLVSYFSSVELSTRLLTSGSTYNVKGTILLALFKNTKHELSFHMLCISIIFWATLLYILALTNWINIANLCYAGSIHHVRKQKFLQGTVAHIQEWKIYRTLGTFVPQSFSVSYNISSCYLIDREGLPENIKTETENNA